MLGNAVHAVAKLLHGTAWGAEESEYHRARGPAAVADVFPYLLSKPIVSEYLLGNVDHAVAKLLHGTVWEAEESEYYQDENIDAVVNLLRETTWGAEESEYHQAETIDVVASKLYRK